MMLVVVERTSAETFCGPRLLSPAMTGMKAESLLYNGEVAFLVLYLAKQRAIMIRVVMLGVLP